jgi:hypothetical protein
MIHLFTNSFSRRTNREIKTIRKASSIKVYRDETNDKYISFTDLEVLKYHREIKIKLFFETYNCKHRYTLIEYVMDYEDDIKLDRFFFSLKKALKGNGSELLGYISLVDIGENCQVHYHITIAIPRIDIKGRGFPTHLKRKFNNRIVHGEFVRNREKLKNYYIPKNIVELGIRKRTFGKSHKYKELPNLIQHNLTPNHSNGLATIINNK